MTKTDSVMGIGQDHSEWAVSVGGNKTAPLLAGNLSSSFYSCRRFVAHVFRFDRFSFSH
jgi:hypothetical protein